jgi:hypothetical protein
MNTPSPPTSTAAIVSLVFGIVAWVGLPLIGAVVAIVAGHIARADIRQSQGRLEGDGFAIAGLLLGWIQLLLTVLVVLLLFMVFGGLAALAIWSS